jgi:hypothetical protein
MLHSLDHESAGEIEQELEDYRSVEVNVVLLKLEWRGHNGETAIRNMPRLQNEFENWRQHAKVSVLLQDYRAPEWEVWSFPARVSGLPVRTGSTYKSEWCNVIPLSFGRCHVRFLTLRLCLSRTAEDHVYAPSIPCSARPLPGKAKRFPFDAREHRLPFIRCKVLCSLDSLF